MAYRIALKDLASCDAMIGRLSVLEFGWPALSSYETCARQDNQLYYLVAGMRDYYVEDTWILRAVPGDLLFMPDHARYRTVVQPGEANVGICIVFALRDADGQPIAITGGPRLAAQDHEGVYLDMARQLLQYALQGGQGNLRAKAVLYTLLSALVGSQRTQAMNVADQSLYPAIRHMEKHLQTSIAIAELAACCHMSESTFYRRFQHFAGTPPLAYHQRRRIEKCCELLESGLYTVEQVAEAMGFCDASYFSRIFKRVTGVSPGAYRLRGR
ncbi:MAG: AraC family transcriptional regulator [Clostridia bacterium]